LIIGLAGHKGSGKDTVAAYLVKEHGFERKAFADPLKNSVAALFDIPFNEVDKLKNNPDAGVMLVDDDSGGAHTMLFRTFLQRYGTESHRDIFGYDFWLDYTLPVRGFYQGRAICVTDVRFVNEAERVRMLGGHIWVIDREQVVTLDTHESEIIDFNYDMLISNNGTIDELYEKVEECLDASALAQTNS